MIYTPELAGWKWFTLTWQNWMKLKIFVWIPLPLKIKTFLNFGWQIRWVSSNISGITGFLENSGWHSMTVLRLSCVLSLSPKVASPPQFRPENDAFPSGPTASILDHFQYWLPLLHLPQQVLKVGYEVTYCKEAPSMQTFQHKLKTFFPLSQFYDYPEY